MGKERNVDIVWNTLEERLHILDNIEEHGNFVISAEQIKKETGAEPRINTKFDHSTNLPEMFRKHSLAILPITRGDYIISHFSNYHIFEENVAPLRTFSLPGTIESIDAGKITSEPVAINCAISAGILSDFLGEEQLYPTVSGRMGTGQFDFSIMDTITGKPHHISVRNSQMEIDAGYEGKSSLVLLEAKRDLSDDFLVRQLYYPTRVWSGRISKPVRPVFFVYSNGIYSLYEYSFRDISSYSSIELVKTARYSVEGNVCTMEDIREIHAKSTMLPEPMDIPFPQADSFERIVNLCELLKEKPMTKEDITTEYDFEDRQADYYVNACRYLGLAERTKDEDRHSVYILSAFGQKVLGLGYRKRQLAFCRAILGHRAFHKAMDMYFHTGTLPTRQELVQHTKTMGLNMKDKDSMHYRRASTILGWVNWVIRLVKA